MFQATRRRLALWYAGITALLLVLFASVVYGYVRTTLVERVDDTLNHVVEVVQRSLVIEATPYSPDASPSPSPTRHLRVNIEDSFRQNPDAVDDDHIDLEWFDNQGRRVWSTLEQPINVPLHVNPYGETVRISPDHLLRQITQRVVVNGEVLGYLRVSHPWFEVTTPSQKLMVDLAAGIVVIVAVVAGVGWFLSGLAMEPVQDSYQKLKQFTADASHELRNPIAVIQTNVQVALADPEPDAQFQQEQFQVIERITRRLGKLVDDLLFLARQDSGIVQLDANPISLGGLLAEVVSDQRAIATEKGIILTLNYPDDSPSQAPTRNESIRNESIRNESIRNESIRNESIRNESIGNESIGNESARNESIRNESIRNELPNSSLSDDAFSKRSHRPSTSSQNELGVQNKLGVTIASTANASPLSVVRGDRNQLTRLFTNLISNAIQYTPPEGQVTISLHHSSHADSRTSQREWAVVRIQDSGIGIAPDELPHIFDRFYRVDRARSASAPPQVAVSSPSSSSKINNQTQNQIQNQIRKPAANSTGAGLGLAIAKTIVDAHQGHISVESVSQGGTTFIVRLPLTHP